MGHAWCIVRRKDNMAPGTPILPATTLAHLFGPLAPLLVLAVLAGLGVLIARILRASWAGRPAPRPRGVSAWRRIARHTVPTA
jgi:hypothetical protein